MKQDKKMKFILLLAGIILIAVMPLTLAVVEIWSSPVYTYATIYSDNHVCIREPWVGWQNPSGSYKINILWSDENYACHYEDGLSQDLLRADENCCPSGYICNSNNDKEGKCIESEIKTCSDYSNNQIACESDDETNHVGISDIQSFKGAGYCTIQKDNFYGECVRDVVCGCVWKDNTCKSYYTDLACNGLGNCKNYSQISTNGSYDENKAGDFCEGAVNPPLGTCITDINIIDNCNTTNQKIVQWTRYSSEGNSLSTSECTESGTKSYPCLGSILSFFSVSAAIIVILIVIAYYLLRKKSKKKKR